MTMAFPELVEVEAIMDAAATIATVDRLDGAYVALPVAVPGAEGLRVTFVYAASRRRPGGDLMELSEPRFVSSFDAETGDVLELKPFDPSVYGLGLMTGWTPTREARPLAARATDTHTFARAFDRLAMAFARGHQPLPDAIRPAAADLVGLYRNLNEPAVADACRAIGATWFTWLEDANR